MTVLEICAGDVMQELTAAGYADMAATIGALVREHGLREGLRRAGLAHR